MPAAPAFACPRCARELPHERLTDGPQRCRWCRGDFQARRFAPPALLVEAASGLAALPEAVACAAHERNAAVAACGRCGAFICALCRIESDGGGWCPPCYERLSAEGALASAATHLRNWGGMSALCLIGAVLLWPLAPLISGLGLYFALRGLRAGPDGRFSLVLRALANGLALFASVAIWILMIGGFIA